MSIEKKNDFLYKDEIESFLVRVINKYEKWFSSHSKELFEKGLDYTIVVETITNSELYSKTDQLNFDEGNDPYEDMKSNWHLYVGVVVEIYRVTNENNKLP